MNRSGSQGPRQGQNQHAKPVRGKKPLPPLVDPIETMDPDAQDNSPVPADPVPTPVKSGGMSDPANPSDNTLASGGTQFDDTVTQQAGDDLDQLKLNPGDKGTQAHQGHVYHAAEYGVQ